MSPKIVSVWEDNLNLIKTTSDVALPKVEFLEVPVPGQELKVQGRSYLIEKFELEFQLEKFRLG